MVTSTVDPPSRTQQRRDVALKRLRGPDIQGTLRNLALNKPVKREAFRLLYGEVRAALGSPSSLPMDYHDMVVHDRRTGVGQQLTMNSMVFRSRVSQLLVDDNDDKSIPVVEMHRGELVCMLCTIRDRYLRD